MSASWDGTVKGCDPEVGRETLKVSGLAPINCVAVHPEQQRIAFGTWNGASRMYDVLEQKVSHDRNTGDAVPGCSRAPNGTPAARTDFRLVILLGGVHV